jgi:polyhydroxyalkanoate synthesis regulator phasin
MKALFLSALMIAGMATCASAQTTPVAKAVEHSNKHRIHEGVKSGELTKAEAKDLHQDNREVKQDVKLAKADGKVSAPEKKVIAKEERHLSKEIYHKKHNGRTRK